MTRALGAYSSVWGAMTQSEWLVGMIRAPERLGPMGGRIAAELRGTKYYEYSTRLRVHPYCTFNMNTEYSICEDCAESTSE